MQIDCPSTWPEGAKIVLVGEGPGREEAEQREGWVGASGKCAQKAAGVAGIDWNMVAKANVTKRYTGKVKFREAFYETVEEPIYTKTGKLSKKTKKIEQKTEELRAWEAALFSELERKHPNLVVAAGNPALEALTGLSGITNYRGSILQALPPLKLKVLAVEHPSYIIRGNLVDFWILAHDLKKAKREMEFPEIRRETWNQYIRPDLLTTLGFLHDVAWAGRWTLDVETRAGTLACFAIASYLPAEGLTTLCVPIQLTSGPYWSPEDELEIWRALRETLQQNPNLCNQNIEYDIYYLLRYGCEPSGVYMDTMLAHSILYPEFPKGLDFLCSFYLDDVIYYKWMGTNEVTKATKDEELWNRCCMDAVYTLRIVDKIDSELTRRGMYEFYHG